MGNWPLPHHARAIQFLVHGWSKQTANILNINAQPAQKGYAPIAFAPHGSISVQNVSLIILLVLKQSFNTGLNSANSNTKKMLLQ